MPVSAVPIIALQRALCAGFRGTTIVEEGLMVAFAALMLVMVVKPNLIHNPSKNKFFWGVGSLHASFFCTGTLYMLFQWWAPDVHDAALAVQKLLGYGNKPVPELIIEMFGVWPRIIWGVSQSIWFFPCLWTQSITEAVRGPVIDQRPEQAKNRGIWCIPVQQPNALQVRPGQPPLPMFAPDKHRIDVKQIASIFPGTFADPGNEECVICRAAFVVGDRYWALPCYHILHEQCTEAWWKEKLTCVRCTKELHWVLQVKK
jgi:hypothetical protein